MPILFAPLIALLLAGAPVPAVDTAVVCPPEYRGAMVPWLEYRAGQGHHIAIVDADGTFQQVRDRLRSLAVGGRLTFVLLVGHAHAAGWQNIPGVPTAFVPAKVNVQWGSEKEIATDGPYGDLDGDGIGELAVGRWPVASPRETAEAVRKVLAYEESTEGGDWQRRISFVAGTSGAGAVPDAALEMAARTLISQYIPPAYVSSMTYASWRSPYCPEPGLFQAMAVERFNEGCLFWVFLGHGQRQFVDYVHVPQGYYPILDRRSAAGLSCRMTPPIALLLACYTGAFDGRDECLAETLFKTPGGPVAVMASSRVSMPYGMSVLGIELMRGYFTHRRPTLGQWQLEAKRDTLNRSRGDATGLLLDTLARVINPRGTDLVAERAEHMALFNLLGDPLLRLKHAEPATVTATAGTDPNDELVVTVASPVDGRGKVEVVVRRDRLTFEPPARANFEPWVRVAEFQEVYHHANDSRLAWTVMDVQDGRATVRVRLPEAAVGPCHVRVFIRDDQGNCALGSSDVTIPKHEPTATRAVGRPAEAMAR